MSLLAYPELIQLIEEGVINANPDNVNSASIDITLGNKLLVEMLPHGMHTVDITDKSQSIATTEIILEKGQSVSMNPGMCVLAHSVETFNLPNNISAEYKLKSSMARNFLEHLNAGWCDAGWNGSQLTLELKNLCQAHHLLIKEGMKIGQVVFFKHTVVPEDKSYATRGQYNNDKGATQSKGIK